MLLFRWSIIYKRKVYNSNAQISEFSQTETSHTSSTQAKNRTRPAHQFPKPAKTKSRKLVAQHHRTLFFSIFGSQKFKIKVLVELVLSIGSERESPGCLFPRFCSLQCCLAYRCIISISSSVFTWPSLLGIFPSYKYTSHMGIKVHSNDWPRLDYICKDPIFKLGNIHKYQGLALQYLRGRGITIQPIAISVPDILSSSLQSLTLIPKTIAILTSNSIHLSFELYLNYTYHSLRFDMIFRVASKC